MRALLLSAYEARSHRYWREGLVSELNDIDWHVWRMPARHFSWRIRGNSLHFASMAASQPEAEFDLIVATSMVDLATLKGISPGLRNIPSILYFHENQLAYPLSEQQFKSLEPAMVNLYGALCADKVCFNSHYNMNSFLGGADKLLRKFPDFVPKTVVEEIRQKSSVLPVPLSSDVAKISGQALGRFRKAEDALHIVWNHRWEYDKGPERLLEILQRLPPDLMLTVHVVGQCFKHLPPCMHEIRAILNTRAWNGYFGEIKNRSEYLSLLVECDCVLSTALHDFQGLSVLEAVACGCFPIVPDRLAYTEFFSPISRYTSHCVSDTDKVNMLGEEAAAAVELIVSYYRRERGLSDREQSQTDILIAELSWRVLGSRYRSLISEVSEIPQNYVMPSGPS